MCLSLMMSIIFNTREPSTQENVSYVLDFYDSDDVNFSHIGELKAKFHTTPFRSTIYVLNIFGFLEVSYRESNWNEGKPRIFVASIFQICQLETPGFRYIFMVGSDSQYHFHIYWFFEFIRVAIRNEGETLIFEESTIQICIMEIPFSTFKYSFQK